MLQGWDRIYLVTGAGHNFNRLQRRHDRCQER